VKRLALLLLPWSLVVPASAQDPPRGAAVYSSFQNGAYWYRDDQKTVFEQLGWPLDTYENSRIVDLAAALDRYAVMVLGTGYNFENPQDFAAQAGAIRAYLEAGGCLVVTDANYPQMYGWLAAVDPGLRWTCRGEMNPYREAPPAWVDAAHPLMRDVKPPNIPWTNPVHWSQAYTPLVADTGHRPVIAYQEIGKGIIVVSSAYRQYDFPNAPFLRNLLAWVKDPDRLADVERRQQAASEAAQRLPESDVPALPLAPAVDGRLDDDCWQAAAVLPDFVAMDGSAGLTRRTAGRVGRTAYGLFFAFECLDADVDAISRRVAERDGAVWTDDCVEVFLAPSGGGEYLHFAVNANGAQYDERGADASWDRYWLARTGVAPGKWTAELFIPFAALDITADSPPAEVWTANFYRECPTRGDLPTELSGWSPTFGSFAAPERFGRLTGIAVPVEGYALVPEIAAIVPERWFGGPNPVTLSAAALQGRAATFTLSLVDVGSQPPAETGLPQALAAGQKAEVAAAVPLDTDAPRVCQFIARDAADPERILAASPVIRATPAPVLDVAVESPAFRATVQSSDPDKILRLTAGVGDPGPVAGDLRLRASLIPKGRLRPVWQEGQTATPRAEVRFEHSVAELPAGEYDVQVDLQDAEQHLIAQDRREVRVAQPGPVEVTFDRNRACLVNGQPVFPIGLYHVSEPALDLINARAKELGLPELTLEEMLTGCRDHGFNTVVRSWGMPGEDYMQIAQRLGLWVLPEVGAPDAATLKGMVSFADRFSNLLMWYGIDEPSGEKLQAALDAHERFAAADPHRPVSAACNNPGVFADGVRAYDLLMMDPYLIYPNRGSSLEPIADWVEAGIKAGDGRVPVWVVPQAFGIDKHWAEPTAEELRCQAYLSVVHGATGLVWYAWYTTEPWSGNAKGRNQWFLPDSPLWDAFTGLNAEIAELSPVFLQAERLGPATRDNEAIHTYVWRADGVTTLIAVNPQRSEQTCRISGLAGTAAEVMFEGREVALQDGAFSDTFAPLAVHVYRLR